MTKPAAEPSDLMTLFILGLLTPFLMAGSITDPELARRAATETIAAYRTTGPSQLVTVAQIIAFALTALDNLRLSLPAEVSLSMKLKLRANANALERVSRQAMKALETNPPETADPDAGPTETDPTETGPTQTGPTQTETAPTETTPKPAQTGPAKAEPANPPNHADLSWASAMTDVAAEFAAELPGLPKSEHRTQRARIDALSAVASTLRQGKAPPLKARLLGSTAIRT